MIFYLERKLKISLEFLFSVEDLISKVSIIYIIKQDIRIYVPLAEQTAGPIGIKFFTHTHGGVLRAKKISFFSFFTGNAGPSASYL